MKLTVFLNGDMTFDRNTGGFAPIINEIGKAPLIALTATATPKVQHDIQKNLGMVDAQVFKSSFNRPNLYYEVRAKTANIDRDIIKFIKTIRKNRALSIALAGKSGGTC